MNVCLCISGTLNVCNEKRDIYSGNFFQFFQRIIDVIKTRALRERLPLPRHVCVLKNASISKWGEMPFLTS